ncbi:amastin-like surface protein, putative [Leishmania donovani]|uniref:Amastin-like surface protein, putative n=1 Tax=Leishmania donovani TaxID=5661 RepID=E9BQX0_LEIDO|nr:amastin-like surface protein, putative [Leishmania donovani]CBZ37649.1 amastin-like surface protein, putative [Leishmania donovani]
MAPSVPLILYVVLQFVAFFFVLVGTPIDMFRSSNSSVFVGQCITLWGFKRDCFSLNYVRTVDVSFEKCPSRIARFRLAQGCAIISIFVYGAAFILGLILLFCCSLLRWVCLVLNVVGMVTSCVVWAAMAVTYNKTDDRACLPVKTLGRYGAAFVLFVLAWILDVINIFLHRVATPRLSTALPSDPPPAYRLLSPRPPCCVVLPPPHPCRCLCRLPRRRPSHSLALVRCRPWRPVYPSFSTWSSSSWRSSSCWWERRLTCSAAATAVFSLASA